MHITPAALAARPCHARDVFSPRIPLHVAALFALLACAGSVFAQSTPLNDTGLITCYSGSSSTGTVSPATPDPEISGYDGQDCTRGAAAADALGKMAKIGASSTPGRDYTKIANNGDELPATATLGDNPTDWACTRDNITGLIWEEKVNNIAHLRHYQHKYTWYDENTAINGGNAGSQGVDTCNATLHGNQCNTSAFRTAINNAGLCGATDWRMPTLYELQSLMDYGAAGSPYIDWTYFPITDSYSYWTGVTWPSGVGAVWVVNFDRGAVYWSSKSDRASVRLVRGGQ